MAHELEVWLFTERVGTWYLLPGAIVLRWPREVLSKVGLKIGTLIPANAAHPEVLRERVVALRGDWT